MIIFSIFYFGTKGGADEACVKHQNNDGDPSPIIQRHFRVSSTLCYIIHEEVDKILNKQIIQLSESPWSSVVILLKNKDRSRCFSFYYCPLNKITKIESLYYLLQLFVHSTVFKKSAKSFTCVLHQKKKRSWWLMTNIQTS